MALSYYEQLNHPKWILKRNEILARDNHKCTCCGDEDRLEVHHLYYERNKMAWEYDNDMLKTMCRSCHSNFTRLNREIIVKLSKVDSVMFLNRISELIGDLTNFSDLEAKVLKNVLSLMNVDETYCKSLDDFTTKHFEQ